MTAIHRAPRIGRALAAGALLGLVGCHQVPSRLDRASIRSWRQDPGASGGNVTPAQEADVQISLGRVAERQGDVEQAMAAYKAALSRDSRRADAYLRLAILNDQQGKFRESAELYRKALALRPGDAEIFCDMGYSFYLQRRWAEADANLKQAIALNPDLQRAHNNLALLLMRDNRREEALAEFRKGGSSPSQAHMNLAFALTMDQRWESAREEYERALALDPASPLAKERLGQLKALIAKREKPREATPPATTVLTTAVDGPSSRPDSPTVRAVTAASLDLSGQVSRPKPPRDPRVVTTAMNVKTRPRTTTRLDPPPLPAEETGPTDFWSRVDRDDAKAARLAAPSQVRRSAGPIAGAAPSWAGNSARPTTSVSTPRPVKNATATSTGAPDRTASTPASSRPANRQSREEATRPDPADAPPPSP